MSSAAKQPGNKEHHKPADEDWKRTVKVLELLARPVMIKLIALQTDLSLKQVTDLRKRASDFPSYVIVRLPQIVQDYLVHLTAKRRPQLQAELEELKRRQNGAVYRDELSAIELAKMKHREDLTKVAKQLMSMWIESLDSGTTCDGYVFGIDHWAFEKFRLENGYMAQRLLTHLKTEFPTEFEPITEWIQLLKSPLPQGCFEKLQQVANKLTFGGDCDLCPR